MTDEALLRVVDAHTYYGDSHVLHGVSLNARRGEVTALLGRNGMGKTTLIRSVIGFTPPRRGKILFHGEEIQAVPSHLIARRGIGLVAQGRRIFPSLTVEEQLRVSARAGGGWTLDRVYALFPRLRDRRHHTGGQLSGGEQQMLAIGRALMTNPRLLLLDEATEGLAPHVRGEIWRVLAALKESGQAILVVDKNIAPLLRLADRHYILEKGRTVWSGTSAELAAAIDLQHRYLGV